MATTTSGSGYVVSIGVDISQNSLNKAISNLKMQLDKVSSTKITVNGQEAIKQIESYTNALGEAMTVTKQLDSNGKSLSTQISKLSNSFTTVSTSTKKWQNAAGETVTEIKKLDSAGKTWITRIKETNNGLGQTSKVTTEYTGNNKKLSESIQTVDDQTVKLKSDTAQLASTTQQTATAQKSLAASFVDTVGKVAKFYVATIPIQAVQTAITETIETIKDYDDAVTEMKKVTDLSSESLDSYISKLTELGSTVGRTTTTMTELATNFLKAGYDESTAADLAQIAAEYQNTADEELSASDATAVLVSQLKAYEDQGLSAIEITDEIENLISFVFK